MTMTNTTPVLVPTVPGAGASPWTVTVHTRSQPPALLLRVISRWETPDALLFVDAADVAHEFDRADVARITTEAIEVFDDDERF